MSIKQVGFDDLLVKNDQTSTRKTPAKNSIRRKHTSKSTKSIATGNTNKSNNKTKKGISPKKISFSQEDMDKLCEIYDWYMLVKDLDILKEVNLKDASTSINIEKDILKTTKRVSINLDKDVWDDFSALCSNVGQKKNEVLSQVIKDFINNHKDLV